MSVYSYLTILCIIITWLFLCSTCQCRHLERVVVITTGYSIVSCAHALQVNTYQAIIASESHTSYVIFIYKNVEWSSPDNTGVTPGSGVGAGPSKLPVLGISDGTAYEQLVSGSSEPRNEQEILSAEINPGNTKVPGVWIFKATAHAQTSEFQSDNF